MFLDPKQDAPEGFTRQGMPPGWIQPKGDPRIRRLETENRNLKLTLAELEQRLERLEENQSADVTAGRRSGFA
jgi:hypothetical protein